MDADSASGCQRVRVLSFAWLRGVERVSERVKDAGGGPSCARCRRALVLVGCRVRPASRRVLRVLGVPPDVVHTSARCIRGYVSGADTSILGWARCQISSPFGGLGVVSISVGRLLMGDDVLGACLRDCLWQSHPVRWSACLPGFMAALADGSRVPQGFIAGVDPSEGW